MAIKTSFLSSSVEPALPHASTKLRAEQMKSEDGFNSLAADLFAIRSQIGAIIGEGYDYKENIDSFDVQLAELNPHLSGSYTGNVLKVKQDLRVEGNTVLGGGSGKDITFNAKSQTSLLVRNDNVVDLGDTGTRWKNVFAYDLHAKNLSNGRVPFVSAGGKLVDDADMSYDTATDVLSIKGSKFGENVEIAGNLTVQGTTTTINSTAVSVDDINIVLGDTPSPTDLTANGGGITLKGATDKTIIWSNASGYWQFSEGIAAPSGTLGNIKSAPWLKADATGKVIAGDSAGFGTLLDAVLDAGTGVSIAVDASTKVSTVSIGQPVAITDDVTFKSVIGSDLTATRLMASDGSRKMVSVADLSAWVAGTANRVSVANDGDGTITLSGPQDLHSGASPEFAALNLAAYGDLLADGSDLKIEAAAFMKLKDSEGTYELAKAGEYASFDAAFSATSIVGALVELAAGTAGGKGKWAQVVASAGATVTFVGADQVGPGSAAPAFPADLGRVDFYVNGQLMADADVSSCTAAGAAVTFSFAVQKDDVVVAVIR
jgi:hypothetical protein